MRKMDGLAGVAADDANRRAQRDFTSAEPDQGIGDAIPWPSPLAPEAYHGLADDLVQAVDPYTEADKAAILTSFLSTVGNVVGGGPHFMAGEDKHQLKIYVVLVGESSKGRKGSSKAPIIAIIRRVDELYARTKIINGGLSTGEGIIWQIRDPITQLQPIKEGKAITGYQEITTDPGVPDKRLLVVEGEFASALKVATRQGNTLSPLIRKMFDDDYLGSLTKNSPVRSTGAHVTIIGHITRPELLTMLTECDQMNGFANRFLWVCVRRSKYLPDGARIPEDILKGLGDKMKAVVDFARGNEFLGGTAEMTRDQEAAALWRKVYPTLSDGKPGLAGAVIARAEAYVMRLACVYALLDKSSTVRVEHLRAALAVWDYCEASAQFIFGESQGDPVADRVFEALKAGPLTQTQLHHALGRNLPAERIKDALQQLSASGKVDSTQTKGSGRKPVTTWRRT